MSSELSELDSILGIPGASINSMSMSDDNLFSQHTFSLNNPLDDSPSHNEIAKLVEQAIETKFAKIEERLVEAIQRENADFYKLFSANNLKIDGILQHCQNQSINRCENKKTGSDDNHGASIDKGNLDQNNITFLERNGGPLNPNAKFVNTDGYLDQRLTDFEKRLDVISENIQVTNKKIGQDLLDLDNNVDQRVEGIEKKLDNISNCMVKEHVKDQNETSERNRIVVKLALIHDSITKLSKDVTSSSAKLSVSTSNRDHSGASHTTTERVPRDSKRSEPTTHNDTNSLDNSGASRLGKNSSKESAQSMSDDNALMQKISKLQKSIDEVKCTVQTKSCNESKVRNSLENINNHIEGQRHLISKPMSSKSSISSPSPSPPCDKKKKYFSDTSSSSSSADSDDDSSEDNKRQSKRKSMNEQLSMLCSGVEEIKEKMNSWLRYSKKAIKNSDENTNVMLERFLSLGMTLQNSTAEDKNLHENILKKLEYLDNTSNSSFSESSHGLNRLDDKVTKLLSVVDDALGNENSFLNLGSNVRQKCDNLEEMMILINTKLDDIPNSTSITQNNLLELDRQLEAMNTNQMGKVDYIIKLLNEKHEESAVNKLDEHSSVLNDIRMKTDDLISNTVPSLNHMIQVQTQQTQYRSSEDVKIGQHLEKIIDLVGTSNEANRNSSTGDGNNFMIQVLKAINDIKNQNSLDGDKSAKVLGEMMSKNLTEIKVENSKIIARLNETLKGKSGDKMLQRVCKLVEESKANDISNMKTLSTINSSIQGIKSNNTKLFSQIKEIKTKSSKQDDLGKTHMVTKEVLQKAQDSSVHEVEDMLNTRFEEMKNLLTELSESQAKSNIQNAELWERKLDSNIEEADLQKIIDAIDSHEIIFKDFQGLENMNSQFQKPINLNLENAIKSLEDKILSLDEDLNQNQKVVSDMLNDVFNEISQKPNIKEIENSHKNSQDVLEERLISNYLKHAAKIFDEMGKQNGLHSEILNSVEDLKLLTSSTPNTVHDLFPLVEKIGGDISKIPDDIGNYMAGLEENLCINLITKIKGIHKTSLQAIFGRFETIEQRMAVIRKYVKYGGGVCTGGTITARRTPSQHNDENASTTNGALSTAEQIEKLMVSQNECLELLKLLPLFQRKGRSIIPFKYKTTAKCIFDLVRCLQDVETVHRKGLGDERKQILDIQHSTKDVIFSKVLPSLENIVPLLNRLKKQRNISTNLLNDITNQVFENIKALKTVELESMCLSENVTSDDITRVVQDGENTLNMLANTVFSCLKRTGRNRNRKFIATSRRKKWLQNRRIRGRRENDRRYLASNQFNNATLSMSLNPHLKSPLKCDDLCENVLKNDQIVLSEETPTENVSPLVGDSSVHQRKRSRNLSSSSDGTIDDSQSQCTTTTVSRNGTLKAYTPQNTELKSPPFLPPNFNNLNQYRQKQMCQHNNSVNQTKPSWSSWRSTMQNDVNIADVNLQMHTLQDEHFDNSYDREDVVTDTSAHDTPEYREDGNGQQQSTNKKRGVVERNLSNPSRKRLKMSKSISSPSSSSPSTTSTTSIPISHRRARDILNR